MPSRRRPRSAGVFLILFGCAFLGITGIFDAMIVQDALASAEARAEWSTVRVRILSSEVVETETSDGTSYSAKVRFSYRVDGAAYEGDRVRLGTPISFGRGREEAIVDRFPAGAEVRAWVDPDDPTRAALDVEGMSVSPFVFVFLTPFHCIGLATLILGVRMLRGGARDEIVDRFLRVDTENRLVVAERAPNALLVFLFALLAISFVAVFVVAFGVGEDPGVGLVQAVMGGTVGVAGGIAVLMRQRARSPRRTLDVDLVRRRYRFPADDEPISLAEAPELRVDSRPTNVRVNGETVHRHFLEMQGADRRERIIFEFKGPERSGRELADALEARLGRGSAGAGGGPAGARRGEGERHV